MSGGGGMAVRLLGWGGRTPSADITPVPSPNAHYRLRRRVVPKAASAIADCVAIVLAMAAAYRLSEASVVVPHRDQVNYLVLALVSNPGWLLVFAKYGLY